MRFIERSKQRKIINIKKLGKIKWKGGIIDGKKATEKLNEKTTERSAVEREIQENINEEKIKSEKIRFDRADELYD